MQQLTHNNAFIDGQNIETGLFLKNLELDYQELFLYLQKVFKVKQVFYCIKFSNQPQRQKLYKELEDIGYNLIFSSALGNFKNNVLKVNVDADLIVRTMQEFYENGSFGLVLLSGDGDFVPLTRFFESKRCFVKIIGADKDSTSKMLEFDRFTKTSRPISYIFPDLQKLTKKISSTFV